VRRATWVRNLAVDAVCRQLDGGSLELHGGTPPPTCEARVTPPPLATLAFAVPAFAPAVDGRAEAHPLPAAWATGRGAVTWFRARTPDGRVVYDGRVGTDAGADMVVNLDNVTPQASVSLAGLTYGEGDGDVWR